MHFRGDASEARHDRRRHRDCGRATDDPAQDTQGAVPLPARRQLHEGEAQKEDALDVLFWAGNGMAASGSDPSESGPSLLTQHQPQRQPLNGWFCAPWPLANSLRTRRWTSCAYEARPTFHCAASGTFNQIGSDVGSGQITRSLCDPRPLLPRSRRTVRVSPHGDGHLRRRFHRVGPKSDSQGCCQ